MIVVSLIKKSIFGVAAVAVLAMSAGATTASAQSPWWHLSSAASPTYLQPGQAKDEVQRLTVSATEGRYLLRSAAGQAILEVGETPEDVEMALEEEMYGVGNVEVKGGPGPEGNNEFEVYEVKFTGKFADQSVELMEIGPKALSGGREEATVQEVTQGRPAGVIQVTAVNLGDAKANPETQPITMTDMLPAGLKAVAIEGDTDEGLTRERNYPLECSLEALRCTFTGKNNAGATSLPPYEQMQMRITVAVQEGAKSGEVNQTAITGGEAPPVTAKQSLVISDAPIPFGLTTYEMRPEEEGGNVATQAGSHPFQLTTTLDLNETYEAKFVNGFVIGGKPAALTKDLHFKLPPGLIGNPTPFAQCPLGEFLHEVCSTETVIGVARVSVAIPGGLFHDAATPFAVPLFNIEPTVGEPARFGFLVHGTPVLLDTAVRTGGDYGVTVNVTNISQTAEFLSSEVTFWGVPGDTRHNNARGEACLGAGSEGGGISAACSAFEVQHPPPLLALPTSCTGPLQSTVEADSWKEPQAVQSLTNTEPMPALDGCNRLQFDPSISVAPDGQAGSTPTGLAVSVHVPQDVSLNPNGLSEADVKNTTVALPAGVGLNPAGADGLLACSEAQIALDTSGPSSCPEASKVGIVKIKTPLLPNDLEGAAYLAAQDANPFGSLVAIYVYVEDPVSGSRVKLAGEVVPDPVTGQLVSTFKNTPQLPFETFELHFFGGDRAPLSTPGLCGAYTTMASIEPWTGSERVDSGSTFDVVSGPNGSPCRSPLPFSPSLTAGTTSIQAGGFSPFTMTMSRPDGSQNLQAVTLKMPLGLLGTLAKVKLCGEAQANAGTCGPESLIGHTTVSVGVGGDPYTVTGGEVFITEGYEGAPYGLSIVNPAKAGPFDLGKVIVRAKIEVDQLTAALTITTDNTGPYKIPTILDGIPLQIQHVEVSVDRPDFTFNPTNCSPLQVGGSLYSSEGSSTAVKVPFQITNCAVLAFKPKLTAKTAGKTSRRAGASLSVKLTYPAGPYDANIAKVKVDLPKQLPSRLTTLQKACTAATFEANPAACPSASIVGHATATTPVLPVPLTGPAYFVSHGGEAFPDLIIVLQGYGATVHLVGSTYIDPKTSITSSTFKAIPDVPVGTFELTLPQGQYSALAANGNLCTTTKLTMPTAFVAQNGAEIHTSTPISPTGCPKHKTTKKKGKKASHKGTTHGKKK
ncbi:MAG TPA: hypothetical protein VIJ39_05765 [Solirubrobacteraceae bacterium]